MSATPASADPSGLTPLSPSRAVKFWWVKIPSRLRRYSFLLWAAWSDGIYLTAWPRLAVVLPVLALAFGLFEGVTHWSMFSIGDSRVLGTAVQAVTFAQMLPLLVLAVVLGSSSANLGLMLVVGYALGDFLVGAPFIISDRNLDWPLFLYSRIPQIASYLLFWLLAVWPIISTKFLVVTAHRRFRESQIWKTVMMALVQALFVYEWTYLAPMLIRQIWNCCFETSPLTVEHFHQATMFWLMGAAVLGVGARRGLINIAEKKDPGVLMRLATVVGQLQEIPYQCPRWLNAMLGAAFLTLLSLGFHSIEQSAPIFVGLAAVLLARVYLLPRLKLWTNWTQRLSRHATLLRLTAATVGTYFICRLIFFVPGQGADQFHYIGDFKAELAALFIGFGLTMVLLPNGALAVEEESEGTRVVPTPGTIPSGVAQVGLIIAIVLLATKKAFADSCLDPQCCFGGNNGLASTSTAAGVPSSTVPGETHEAPQIRSSPEAPGTPGMTTPGTTSSPETAGSSATVPGETQQSPPRLSFGKELPHQTPAEAVLIASLEG